MPKSDQSARHRQARDLRRRKASRPPYDRVLIVSEGSKTEPAYFNDIRIQFRLPSAHILVIPSDYGTDPLSVVRFAEDKAKNSRAFEWVFAVFDRDEHDSYDPALQKAASLDNKLRNDERKAVRFHAIPSVPCFELWLLLHHVDVHAVAHRDEIIRRVREKIPGYAKGAKGIYAKTAPMIDDAIKRAAGLRAKGKPEGGHDAYTSVDVVVTTLFRLRK